jgi:hypothetical protein
MIWVKKWWFKMGGIGSGTYIKYKSRLTTADYYALDLRKLNKLVTLDHTCGFTLEWSVKSVVKSSVQCVFTNNVLELHYAHIRDGIRKAASDYINVTSLPCNFGGERQWLVCPDCQNKTLLLYVIDKFKCRKCHGLYHPSSNEGELYRSTRAMCNYQNKLNGKHLRPIDGMDGISKPKWMRHKTYERLKGEAILSENKYNEQYSRVFKNYFRII